MEGLNYHSCTLCYTFMYDFFVCSVDRSDYLNTFDFLDKLAENLTKKQTQSHL